ncbi:MAG TPA: GatB/YqeY domain-containing protein [Steroidobacteraceae bacterium]
MAGAEESLRARLGPELRVAIKARDGARIAALRTLAAALDNATAVPIEDPGVAMPSAVTEVPRKVLTDDDVRSILLREIAERADAAFAFEMHGCFEEALGVRAEIAILEDYARDIESGEHATSTERVDTR